MLVDKSVNGIFESGTKLVVDLSDNSRVLVKFKGQDSEYIYGEVLVSYDELEMKRFGLSPNEDNIVNRDKGCAIRKSSVILVQVIKDGVVE